MPTRSALAYPTARRNLVSDGLRSSCGPGIPLTPLAPCARRRPMKCRRPVPGFGEPTVVGARAVNERAPGGRQATPAFRRCRPLGEYGFVSRRRPIGGWLQSAVYPGARLLPGRADADVQARGVLPVEPFSLQAPPAPFASRRSSLRRPPIPRLCPPGGYQRRISRRTLMLRHQCTGMNLQQAMTARPFTTEAHAELVQNPLAAQRPASALESRSPRTRRRAALARCAAATRLRVCEAWSDSRLSGLFPAKNLRRARSQPPQTPCACRSYAVPTPGAANCAGPAHWSAR